MADTTPSRTSTIGGLTRLDAPGRPEAVIVMLHGGKPRSAMSGEGRSASWLRSAWMARAIAGEAHQGRTSVWLARYRERGWNGGADRLADARDALDHVVATHGRVPVVLLGHSMGARVAVHVADHPTVVGVVGLAPWWSHDDPVQTLAGRSLVAAHGRRDRITSYTQTVRYLERARRVADAVSMRDMGPLGHYMITDAAAWNRVALQASLYMLSRERR